MRFHFEQNEIFSIWCLINSYYLHEILPNEIHYGHFFDKDSQTTLLVKRSII